MLTASLFWAGPFCSGPKSLQETNSSPDLRGKVRRKHEVFHHNACSQNIGSEFMRNWVNYFYVCGFPRDKAAHTD